MAAMERGIVRPRPAAPAAPAETPKRRMRQVVCSRRTGENARAVRAAFAERGESGAPMVVTYRVNAGPMPAGSWLADPREGGRLIGEGCHFVDFCGALIGADPLEVPAGGLAPAGGGGAAGDTVVVTVRYAGGSLATIQYVTVGHPDLPKERCEVSAGGRTAVVDDFRVTRFHGGGRNVRGRQAKGFAETLRAFLDACRDGGPWPIPWRSLGPLFRAVAETLRTIAAAPRHLGAEIGFFAVLHTWGQVRAVIDERTRRAFESATCI